MKDAWNVYQQFLSDSRVRLLPEPQPIEDLFCSYSITRNASPKIWVDAYLAAYAAASNATLVTFDKALEKYPVKTRILKPQ